MCTLRRRIHWLNDSRMVHFSVVLIYLEWTPVEIVLPTVIHIGPSAGMPVLEMLCFLALSAFRDCAMVLPP